MIDMEAEQEFATRCYGKEMYNDGKAEGIVVGIEKGKAEGIAVGKEEGMTYAIVNLVKKGLLSVKDAAKELNISENEFKKLEIENI